MSNADFFLKKENILHYYKIPIFNNGNRQEVNSIDTLLKFLKKKKI